MSTSYIGKDTPGRGTRICSDKDMASPILYQLAFTTVHPPNVTHRCSGLDLWELPGGAFFLAWALPSAAAGDGYHFSAFKGCGVDLSVGIDISTSSERAQRVLPELLPRLMQQLALLSNISCDTPGQMDPRFRYVIPGSSGQLVFDSGFEKYNDETIQKFLIHQASVNNRMDTDFLQSLGETTIHLSFAKVKVMHASDPVYGDLGQGRIKRFCN